MKLINQYDGKIAFNYYPDEKDDFGTVSINENTGEVDVLTVAKSDEFGSYKIYAIKSIFKIRNSYLKILLHGISITLSYFELTLS